MAVAVGMAASVESSTRVGSGSGAAAPPARRARSGLGLVTTGGIAFHASGDSPNRPLFLDLSSRHHDVATVTRGSPPPHCIWLLYLAVSVILLDTLYLSVSGDPYHCISHVGPEPSLCPRPPAVPVSKHRAPDTPTGHTGHTRHSTSTRPTNRKPNLDLNDGTHIGKTTTPSTDPGAPRSRPSPRVTMHGVPRARSRNPSLRSDCEDGTVGLVPMELLHLHAKLAWLCWSIGVPVLHACAHGGARDPNEGDAAEAVACHLASNDQA